MKSRINKVSITEAEAIEFATAVKKSRRNSGVYNMKHNKLTIYINGYIKKLRDPQYLRNNRSIKLSQSTPDLGYVLGCPWVKRRVVAGEL